MAKIPARFTLNDEEIAKLQRENPKYRILDIVNKLKSIPVRRRFSQEDEAEDATSLAHVLNQAFAGVSGSELGGILREHRNDDAKLTKVFDRRIATNLKSTAKRPVTKQAPKRNRAETAPLTRPSQTERPARAQPSFLLPTQPPAERLQDATGEQRPYNFEKFAGMVFKTGVHDVTRFFGAIQKAESMAVLQDLARKIERNPEAKAALSRLEPKDRALFDAVLQSLPQ